MKEYIDKSVLLETMSRNSITEKITFADGKSIIETVRDFPAADVVEVVRCKDCKYWQDNNGGYPHEDCRWGKDETPDGEDFCSYGERRSDT